MEYINKIEILGTVGNIRITEVGDRRVAHVSVATDYAYQDRSGNQCIDVTWHNVSIWTRPDDKNDIASVKTGTHLYVLGRIRQYKYVDAIGVDHFGNEIIASKWDIR